MKLLYLPVFIFICFAPALSFADAIDKVAALLRQGNIHDLAQLFASEVEINIQGDENVYSKVQAELILDKFFDQNKPRAVQMLHKINSNPNYMFGVLIMNTNTGPYRITFTLKQTEGSLMLIEMRIETEKVK